MIVTVGYTTPEITPEILMVSEVIVLNDKRTDHY